jgi:hypothetical protein
MGRLRLVGAVLAVAFVFSLFASASASAVSFSLAEWLVNGSPVTSELLTETTGEFLLEDSKAFGGKASVLCSGSLDGWVGPNSLGWISELLTLAGVAVSTIALSGTPLECTAQAGCEVGTKPKVWATNLGWEAEAELMVQGTEVFFVNLILPHAGGGNPGWEIECTVIGIKFVDECTAAESIAELKLEGATLLEKFSKAFSELAVVKLANCSMGGTESGVVEGEDSVILSGGGALSVSSEGGGGGAEATSLSTALSGEGKEGETITVLEGSKVKDKATLKGKNASTATGKVTYKVYSDNTCKTLVTSAGEVTVSGESIPASSEAELEGGASYYWQAHYSGDSKNAESKSECTEISTVRAKTSLSTKLSGESKEGEELTVLAGSKVKDTATLSGSNSSTSTGKVLYKIYSDKECKTLVKEAGEVTLEAGAKIPASTEEELEAGKTYYWQATYKGDTLHQESTSTCGKEVLNVKAATKLATLLKDIEHSGETVEATEQLAVTDTATLSGTNSSTATGTVTYNVYTEKECKTLEAEAGSVTVTSGSVPSSTEETLPAGTYYWQATYSGDALHQASTSSCGSEIDTVKAVVALSTSLSGEGQSNTGIEVVEGTGITDNATLSGPDTSNANGTVAYNVYSDEECKTLVTEAGKVTVTNGSVPASTEEILIPGRYYWQATYSGDANNAGETGTCGGEIAVVNSATSLATSLSGGGQEGETISVPEGTAITDTATLSGTNASKAGGTVTYGVYSDEECKTLVAEAGSVTVTSGVVPSSGEQRLSPGTYYWQAFYSGDSNNHQSTSSCKEVAVVKATTSLATSLTGGGHSHQDISVLEGTGVTDSATLSGEDTSTAGGTVTYDVYSDKECKTLAAEAGKVTVTSGDVPASSEEKLKAGTYYWQATYSGDANNMSSSSICGKEILIVNKTLLSTSLVGEGQSGEEIHVVNGATHDTSTLSGENAFIATGKVKYDVYSDKECKTLVAEAGEVTVISGLVPESNEENLSPGTYYWQATYSGDSNNEGSTTPCDAEVAVVGPAPPQVEHVEFTNDMAVIVDHPDTGSGEKPEAIGEFTGKDNVQWEYSPTDNELMKSWPVAYVKETTPTLKARFELPSATKQIILEKRIEGKPVISGHTTLNGETLTFTKEFTNAEELETQVKTHEGYIEIGETTAVSANKGLPARVAYETMAIEWEWTVKIKSNATNTKQSLGSSALNLYLTNAEPPAPACKTISEIEKSEGEPEEIDEEVGTQECTPIYLAQLDRGVKNIEQAGASTPAAQITAIWEEYTKIGLLYPPQQAIEPNIEIPLTQLPIYDPRRGVFLSTTRVVRYYEFIPQRKTADQSIRRVGCGNELTMLATGPTGGVGRCGAWARYLAGEMNTVIGRGTAEVVGLTVSFGPSPEECNEGEPDVCVMLVKRWRLSRVPTRTGTTNFPWTASSLEDLLGAAGQANENPPGYFWDHAIVKAGNMRERSSALYDPSYGAGPFPANLKDIENRGQPQPSEQDVLKQYQEASIEGFCRPTLLGRLRRNENPGVTRLPAQCSNTTVGERVRLKPARLTWP